MSGIMPTFLANTSDVLSVVFGRSTTAGAITVILFSAWVLYQLVYVSFVINGIWQLLILVKRARRAYFTSLNSLPGPWHARLTGLGLKLAILRGQRCHYVQGLHQQYGDFVRIAPNEVIVRDPTASWAIHSVGSRFLKVHIPAGPVPNIFNIIDPKEHNVRQRFYAKAFSQASLRKTMEPAVRDLAQMAVSRIKRDGRSSGIADIHEWCMLYGNDVMCRLTYGEGFGLMEKGQSLDKMLTADALHLMIAWAQFSLPLFLLGRLLSPFSRILADTLCAEKQYGVYGPKAIQQTRADGKSGPVQTVFARARQDAKADDTIKAKGKQLTDEEIAVDAAGFHLAGAETVGITLVYLIWCVLQQPTLQKQLEEEVAGVGEITDTACEKLPILSAVINETLRLHGGNPTGMKRTCPPGGATLGGYRIPQGTIVTTQAYSLHRNPKAWNDPETFDHTRWLSPSQSSSLSTPTFQPFSAGTRICAGYQLVMMELRLMAAIFFRECPGARLAASTTPESMVVEDRFNVHPISRRCEIVL